MRILHLEDSILDHQLIVRALEDAGLLFAIARVDTLEGFTAEVAQRRIDVVLADYRLPGFSAIDAWATMPTGVTTPFILVSGAIGEAAAVAAIQMGISDFLHKDEIPKIGRVVRRALEVQKTQDSKISAERELVQSKQRLAQFTAHLQTAIENERASIAREIHDDVGGALTAANLDIRWISRHAANPDLQAHAQSAASMVQLALGASQRIMLNLRPSILDQGLVAAAQWLATDFERRTGIKTVLNTTSDEMRAEKTVQLAAYRTVQEALTNASKHAECSQVRIDLSDSEGVLTVEVADNGLGFSERDRHKPLSYGLRGLQERASAIGGWLDISTHVGKGTSITLSVPLNPENGLLIDD